MNTLVADDRTAESRNRLAVFMRWAGAALVLVAGSSFMLQGLDQIAEALRSWSILGLMLLFAGSGYLVQKSFEDAKGARLLLGLAVLLVPVQFSQLAGMIHELYHPGSEAGSGWLGIAGLLPNISGPAEMGLLILATAGVGFTVLAAGFRVLAGEAARTLALAMMTFCALLLVPARDSLGGLVVPGLLALGYLIALGASGMRLAGQSSPQLRTFEGRCALMLLALPLGIAVSRYALHAQTLIALFGLLLMVASLLVELPQRLLSSPRLIAAVSIPGLGLAGLAWLGLVMCWTLGWSSEVAITLAAGPVLCYWLETSRRLSAGGPLVRIAASGVLWIVAIGQLEQGTFAATLWLLGLAFAVVAWSVLRQSRVPAIAGLVVVIMALVQVLQLSLANVVFSGWLLMAGSGLALVVLASILERYGSRMRSYGRGAWNTVRGWD